MGYGTYPVGSIIIITIEFNCDIFKLMAKVVVYHRGRNSAGAHGLRTIFIRLLGKDRCAAIGCYAPHRRNTIFAGIEVDFRKFKDMHDKRQSAGSNKQKTENGKEVQMTKDRTFLQIMTMDEFIH